MMWILFIISIGLLGYLIWDHRNIKNLINSNNLDVSDINKYISLERQKLIDDYEKQIDELISFTKEKLKSVGINFDK